jgi:lysozyme family protein
MQPDFERAFKCTLGFEGAYSNDAGDRGGETYCGISRKAHPLWAGWPIIDRLKVGAKPWELGRALAGDQALPALVRQVYRAGYWDALHGDQMGDHALAAEMFDAAVNHGAGQAAIWLQRTLNCMNKAAALWPDLKPDGDLGPVTLRTLGQAYAAGIQGWQLANALACYRGRHYIDLVEADQTQERFFLGWISNRIHTTTLS